VPASANLTGMSSECGNLGRVAASPYADIVVAGVAQHGLWASENGAKGWTQLGTASGSATITNRTSAIVYDPNRPGTFWESGTYNGGGVYRTDDNGATFKPLGNMVHADAVSVDLSDPAHKTLLAGKHESSQLYRSTDGGSTWVDISASLPAGVGFVEDPLVIDATTFVLGTTHGQDPGIFRSTDRGNSWTQVHHGAVAGAPVVTKGDGTMYWMTNPAGGLLKSTDGGTTWSQVARDGTLNVASPTPTIIELPGGQLGAIGNRMILTSADHGVTWQRLGPPTPITPQGLTYAPYRHAFYIWYNVCDLVKGDNPITDNNIMRLDLEPS
jgi:photosystem II stability/assembly factor-like uncharacterized protein